MKEYSQESVNKGKKMNKLAQTKKKISGTPDDSLNIDNWMLVKAITPFPCEHEGCKIKIAEEEYYILFLNEKREKNICIKHGIQRIKKQKRQLEVFETRVLKTVGA